MAPAGRSAFRASGPFVGALALLWANASAAIPACRPEFPARESGIRDVLPIDGRAPPPALPRVAPLQDGMTCWRGHWMMKGRKATRAEIEAHLKRVMANRLM